MFVEYHVVRRFCEHAFPCFCSLLDFEIAISGHSSRLSQIDHVLIRIKALKNKSLRKGGNVGSRKRDEQNSCLPSGRVLPTVSLALPATLTVQPLTQHFSFAATGSVKSEGDNNGVGSGRKGHHSHHGHHGQY